MNGSGTRMTRMSLVVTAVNSLSRDLGGISFLSHSVAFFRYFCLVYMKRGYENSYPAETSDLMWKNVDYFLAMRILYNANSLCIGKCRVLKPKSRKHELTLVVFHVLACVTVNELATKTSSSIGQQLCNSQYPALSNCARSTARCSRLYNSKFRCTAQPRQQP